MTRNEYETETGNWYDYKVQAWVRGGRYQRCGHPEAMNCECYGREHEGEEADPAHREV